MLQNWVVQNAKSGQQVVQFLIFAAKVLLVSFTFSQRTRMKLNVVAQISSADCVLLQA